MASLQTVRSRRNRRIERLGEPELPVVDYIPSEPDPVEPEPATGPQTPLSGFDLLEGTGRRKLATRRLNRWVLVGGVIVVVLSLAYSFSVRQTRADLSEAIAQGDADVAELNRSIQAASNSLLPEATLDAHVTSRTQQALDAYTSQTPYEQMYRDVFAVAGETGVTVSSVDFSGTGDSGTLTMSGSAPSLPVLGQFTTLLQSRHGVEREVGYLQPLVPTYRSNPETDELTFSAEAQVTLEALQLDLACSRLATLASPELLTACPTTDAATVDDETVEVAPPQSPVEADATDNPEDGL